MSFFDNLQPASLGGVPFGVLGGEGRFGRRIQLHQYPFRDMPWPEDLGRGARRIDLTGFLLEGDALTGGGDVIAQLQAMIGVVEQPGPLTLVHPTLGTLKVVVPEECFRHVERWDAGRFFEISISCIEAGQRIFPSVAPNTGAAVSSAYSAALPMFASDFSSGVTGALGLDASVISMAISVAASWGAIALSLGGDASAVFHMTAELQGSYGRYFGGAVSGFLANASPTAGTTPTTASLIAQGAANLAAVGVAVDGLAAASATGSPGKISAAAQAVPAAVLAATVNPADSLRLLSSLSDFSPQAFTTSDVVGQAMASVQVGMGNLFRRLAVVTLANASAGYQPSSADDASAVRDQVTGLIDNEVEMAGDGGEDASFRALRTLRQAVVADLNSRGAALPSLKTFEFQAQLPAAALALRIYRDPSRADQLVSQANPAHPSFMPRSFQALAR